MPRHAIAILVPALIWTVFGAACVLDPAYAFSGPMLGYAIREDVEYSAMAKLGIRFAGCYLLFVGVYGFLVYFDGGYAIRKFWLFGQLVFCASAAVVANALLFKVDDATLALYTPHFRSFIDIQKPVLNLFGLFFCPLSLIGYLAPAPTGSSQSKLLGSVQMSSKA